MEEPPQRKDKGMSGAVGIAKLVILGGMLVLVWSLMDGHGVFF